MTFRDEEYVRDHLGALHKTPRAVLRALAARTDSQGVCWPSQALLARDTGLARSTVARCLAYLEEIGLISRVKRSAPSRGGRMSDLISVDLEAEYGDLDYSDFVMSRTSKLPTHNDPSRPDPMSHSGDPMSHSERSNVSECDRNQKENQQEPTGYPSSYQERYLSDDQVSGYQQEEVTSSRASDLSDRILSSVAYAMAESVSELASDPLWDLYTRIMNQDFSDQSPTLRKANEALAEAVNKEMKTRFGVPGSESDVR